MNLLDQISIRMRLLGIIILMTTLIAGVGFIGLRGMTEGFAHSEMLMQEHVKPALVLSRVRLLMAESRAQVMLSLQHDPKSPLVGMHDHPLGFHTDQVVKTVEEIDALMADYQKRQITDPAEIRLLAAFTDARKTYLAQGLTPAREALLAGEYLKANEILLKQINPLFKAATKAGEDLATNIVTAAEDERKASVAEHYSMLRQAGIAVAIGILAAIASGWALQRAIVLPLERLRGHFATMAGGDLRQPVEISGRNEITEVQQALATTQAQLVDLVGEIRTASGQLATHSAELSTTVRTVAENSRAQQDGVMEVSAAMEEVSVSIGEVAKSTGGAAAAADLSATHARNGHAEVDRTATETHLVGEAMQASAQTMRVLQDSVEKINAVTKVIREVADQTNLLALNAAIEAARAGEQGRGFAVVADEVRKLAERTTKSTADIAGIVNEVRRVADQAAGSLGQAQARVESASTAARASGTVLSEVLGAASTVSQLTRSIAEASAEQSTATTSVAQHLERITSLISDTHGRVGQVEEASEELAATARRLQDIVSRFQV